MIARRGLQQGFTLVELVIVVLIVMILAAIAIPAYNNYVLRGRRSDAYSLLSLNQTILERCYAQSFSYTTNCPALTTTSQNGYYTLASTLAATSYSLTASPTGPQTADTACASFTVTSTNVRSAKNSGGSDSTSTCWAQ
ncbi:MAG: prepilin-type N-terminal cleavage/methylation domain-containing protein [Proteobacteria bacterium]|nr:prepilin-type N-terminal cleavage/methylation domain-containing protein [Pseudomonadota bacterium]